MTSSSAEVGREVLIGIPVYGRLDLLEPALRAVAEHTPDSVPIAVIDDCGPEPVPTELLSATLGHPGDRRDWQLVRHPVNRGFVGSANHLFELAGQRDVILLNSDVTVLPGWFAGLHQATLAPANAALSNPIASASALADSGGLLSVAELGAAPSAERLAQLRDLVPAAVDIPVAVAHCTWFRRPALDTVGAFDLRFAPGYGEEVDWSLRAVRAGFRHVAATGSYVRHVGSASFGPTRSPLSRQRRHELLLLMRYRRSWFDVRRFARDQHTELARVRSQIARALDHQGVDS